MNHLGKPALLTLALLALLGKAQQNGQNTSSATPIASNAVAATPGDQQTVGTVLGVKDFLTTSSPFKCIESYLYKDTSHDGSDYGAAINAADQDSSLISRTELKACVPGDHPIYTTATIDRAIGLWMDGTRLIPQSTLSSTPVFVPGAVATGDSMTISMPYVKRIAVNMAVGGVGIPPGAYVAAVSAGSITISLPAKLQFYGVVTKGTTIIRGVSSMSGLAVGQTLNVTNAWPFVTGVATIRSIDKAGDTLTVSSPADSGSAVPTTFITGGTWTTNLTFVKVTPVLKFVYNQAALHNNFMQMYGASMHSVWIEDVSGISSQGPSHTDRPGMPGIQGVQIYGYDGFSSYDLHVENLQGSCEILGGNTGTAGDYFGPVRESSFYGDQIRNCGDAHTGQAALVVMTPGEDQNETADEDNEISFIGGRYVYSSGVALNIGTYNRQHKGNFGPGGLHFSDDFQIEGWIKNADISAQSDTVVIQRAGDIHFEHGYLLVTGQGKALINADIVYLLSIEDCSIQNQGIITTYQVEVNKGSDTVKYVSGGGRELGFNTIETWDGMGVQVNGHDVWLAPLSPVAGDGRWLRLAIPWAGTSGTYPMKAGFGGIMVESSMSIGHINFWRVTWPVLDDVSLALLGGVSYDHLFEVGAAFHSDGAYTQDNFNRNIYTIGPTQLGSSGPTINTDHQGTFLSWNQSDHKGPGEGIYGETDFVNVVHGAEDGGWCYFNVLVGDKAASPTTCILRNGGLVLSGTLSNTLTANAPGIVLAPFNDISGYPEIYGTNAARDVVNWSITRGNASLTSINVKPISTKASPAAMPNVSSAGDGSVDAFSYKVKGTAGYNGKVTVGSCVLSIAGGIITQVAGCNQR